MIKRFREMKPQFILLLIVTMTIRVGGGGVNSTIPSTSEINFLNAIAHMTNTVSLDTQYYNHPDNVTLFCGLLILNATSLITKHTLCTGTVSSVLSGDITSTYFDNNFDFYIAVVRVMNVGFSMLAIWWIYKAAEAVKQNAGFTAALMAALFSSYNVWSGYILSDTCLTALASGVIYFAIQYMKNESKKYLYLTTIFCGMCTIQKYTGLLTCIVVIWLVLYEHRGVWNNNDEEKRLLLFTKCCMHDGIKLMIVYVFTLFVCAPNVITNIGRVVQIILFENRLYHMGADGLGFIGNFIFYANVYWTQMGVLLVLLAVAGFIFCVKRKNIFCIPVLWGCAFWILISLLNLHWERWGLAIYITPIIFAGIGYSYLTDYMKRRNWRKINFCFKVSLCLICMMIGTDVWLDMIVKSLPDTRLIAEADLETLEYDINRENSYFELGTPFAPQWNNYGEIRVDDETKASAKYVMVASSNYDAKFSSERHNSEIYGSDCDWYRLVFANGQMIYEIKPWIQYKLLRDSTAYGDMKLTVPVVKSWDNIRKIMEYYRNPDGKYYGPAIYIYKIN